MASRIQPKTGGYLLSKSDFTKVFEDVPKIAITSSVDLRNKFDNVKTILSNTSEDWNKRQTQLKTIRSLIINGEKLVDRPTMIAHLLQLLGCFELAVKDLRSQILREAAITCSFIVSKYGIETHSIGEDILIPAMAQVAVSTKIMATSASTLTEFIVEYIQTRQVFTILSSFSTSKDKNQRRQLAVLLEIIIGKWSDRLKKQIIRQICELVKSAINDADSETRAAGRRAFAKLEEFHSEEADALFLELEHSKQKMLRGGDAASSWASINSDKGSIPIRSKLSAGAKGYSNISAKFLAQRSASAIDPKALKVTGPSRLARPLSTKAMVRQDTSPAGSKIPYPNRPGSRTRTSSITSNDSRDTSPRNSPLPPDNHKARVKYGNGSFFAKLGMPDTTDDDEFLLPIRVRSPQKPNLGDSPVDNVSRVLKECCSSSVTEKKEGIKKLLPIVSDTTLSSTEIKNIGNCLNRLLSDASNTMVLEVYAVFIRTHSSRLSEWLRLALAKLFARKATETLPNTKKQINHTLNVILECFNAHHQLVTVCELMCDPIHLMVPKARVALLEYMTSLLDEYTEPGASINHKELKAALRKMFTWIGDQRQSILLTPYIEKAICSMFCVNVADFSALISEFDSDQKAWLHQTLQLNGLENGISSGSGGSGNNHPKATPLRETPHKNDSTVLPEFGSAQKRTAINLGSFNTSTNAALSKLEEQSTSRLMEKMNLNSTVTLPPDTLEKIQNVQDLLHKMRDSKDPDEQENAISQVYMKICDGGFGIWEQCYAKLLLNLFEILSTSRSENNKKMCLRILGKMCTAQAAKLFDSTEMAVCKVLDAAVNTNDATTALAVDDCLRTLATHLPLANIINIAKVILIQEPIDDERASLVLKMVTRLFEELPADELKNVVDDITPCVIKAYQSTSSSVRKTVVYCLVAMVNRVGEQRMAPHFTKLPKAMTNLIQVYVNRAISTSLPRL